MQPRAVVPGVRVEAAMKLYEAARAPNPRRVRIFLAEKEIEVPSAQLDIGKREHQAPDYAAKNPMQKVPALELDDGTIIAESVAICRYFETLKPSPALFGTDAVTQAKVEMWNRQVELYLLMPIAMVFRHTHPFMAPFEVPQIAPWGEANRDRVVEFLRHLDGELTSRSYVAGEAFSIADITALVAVDFMRLPKIDIPADLTNLRRWHGNVSARPSARP